VSTDYQKFVAIADRLVGKFGRKVDLIRTSGAPADADRPWEGPEAWDDATAATKDRVRVTAAFIGRGIPLTQGRVSGQQQERSSTTLTQEGTDIFLVGGSVDADLLSFTKLIDKAQVWSIDKVVKIEPGDTVVVYVIEVHQ